MRLAPLLALSIIAAPQAAAAACAPGVYVDVASASIALSPVKADHRKVAGLAGAMLLGPLGGNRMKIKTVVAGPSAPTSVASAQPSFRMCFAAPIVASGTASDYVGPSAAAQSPSDFQLVRFEQGKSQRELELAAIGGFSGPEGKLSKSVIPFRTEQVAPGEYQVILSRDLPPGQYGFLQTVTATTSTRQKDVQEQVYDFAVTG